MAPLKQRHGGKRKITEWEKTLIEESRFERRNMKQIFSSGPPYRSQVKESDGQRRLRQVQRKIESECQTETDEV